MQLIDACVPIHEDSVDSTPEKLLKTLTFILHDNFKLLDHALEVLDDEQQSIVRYQCSTYNRYIWRVTSRRNSYICLAAYCPCRSYFEQSKVATSKVLCKHLLAIRIGHQLKTNKEEVLSNELFVELMSSTGSTAMPPPSANFGSSSFR